MKRYRYNSKRKKERSERIGFVTALSVCVIAIGLAIGSTYASIGGLEGNLSGGSGSSYTATAGAGSQEVDNEVKGIVAQDRSTDETSEATVISTTEAQSETQSLETEPSEPDVPDTAGDKLQTILQVPTSLLYPVDSEKIIKEYI